VPHSHFLIHRRSGSSHTLGTTRSFPRAAPSREQSLTSASNATCRRTFSSDSCSRTNRVHARACISLLGDICSQLFHNEVAAFARSERLHRSISGLPDATVLRKNAYFCSLAYPLATSEDAPVTNAEDNDNKEALATCWYLNSLS